MTVSSVEQVAEEYRAEGYDVLIRPQRDQLPEFLQQHQPDLLAERAGESVVVQFVSHRELAESPVLREIAAEIDVRPGWRFDLVVSSDNAVPETIGGSYPELSGEQVELVADRAQSLLRQGELEASCLVAWSAVEATLRAMARRELIELQDTAPQFILKTLITEGVLDRQYYTTLRKALETRNALAHGFQPTGLDRDMVQFLIQFVRQMLEPELQTS